MDKVVNLDLIFSNHSVDDSSKDYSQTARVIILMEAPLPLLDGESMLNKKIIYKIMYQHRMHTLREYKLKYIQPASLSISFLSKRFIRLYSINEGFFGEWLHLILPMSE